MQEELENVVMVKKERLEAINGGMQMMKIIVANNIRIIEPDERIKEYAENNLVIQNPDYIKNERLNYSNWKTPRYLVYYEINGDELILPFGVLTDLFKMYDLYKFENKISYGEKIEYKSKINLFDYQEKVVEKAIQKKNGRNCNASWFTERHKQH